MIKGAGDKHDGKERDITVFSPAHSLLLQILEDDVALVPTI